MRSERKPILVDLFCGAGGCSVGYSRAGFDVVGIDINPHPDYPYTFIEGDVMTLFPRLAIGHVAAIAASPPCPRYSSATPAARRDAHPDLVEPVREMLAATGLPYVIENVPGAPLLSPTTYCGSSFGLGVRRHRLFESNIPLTAPPCDHKGQTEVWGVYGQHGDKRGPVPRPNGTSRGGKARDAAHAREVMGIDWMSEWHDLADAIPPAYTEHIGRQLMAHLDTNGSLA